MNKWFRIVLLATGVMNMFGALLFAPIVPQLRELYGLPGAHPLYLWIISIWIFLFGVCYLWLAFTGARERLFLVIGATGKLSFFGLMLVFWVAGELPIQAPIGASADLFFGIIFLGWLRMTRVEESPSLGERW